MDENESTRKLTAEEAAEHNRKSALLLADELRLVENHICTLTAALRTGLKNGTTFRLMPVKLIDREEFEMMPEKKFFFQRTRRFSDIEKWFRYSYNKRRMCNVKLMMERNKRSGQSEAGGKKFLCVIYEDETASCYSPEWTYDEPTNKWSVVYREKTCCCSSLVFQHFEDNSDMLRKALTNMSDFAHSLGCDTGYLLCCLDELDGRQAKWEAYSVLADESKERTALIHTPKLPERLAHIYTAASRAPAWNVGKQNELKEAADRAGRTIQYNNLMEFLSMETSYAMMYAVNEC